MRPDKNRKELRNAMGGLSVTQMVKEKSKRILVVDDDELVREILSKMLSAMGFDVDLAGSGSEGLNLFLRKSFDLVLTDLQMPGMDGFTLALNIKDESPETPIVLITGHDKVAVMEKVKESCVDSVMFKPFRLEEIQETVQKMLAARRALDRVVPLSGLEGASYQGH